MKVFEDGKGADWPSKANILNIALRNGEGMEQKVFDLNLLHYWDHLLVKVCTMFYWNPNKRYYGNISTHKEKEGSKSNLNAGPYVDPSAEAFLVWTYENAYDKWRWTTKLKALLIELEAKRVTQAQIDKQRLEDNVTPYTNANGGQQKWGGITPEGQQRYVELVKMITKNRAENADAIKVVEDRVLIKVRAKHDRDEVDEKNSGKKKPRKKVAPVEPDEVVDENDFDTWIVPATLVVVSDCHY